MDARELTLHDLLTHQSLLIRSLAEDIRRELRVPTAMTLEEVSLVPSVQRECETVYLATMPS